MGEKGRQSTSATSVPGWLKEPLKGGLQGLLGNDPSAKMAALGQFTFDPSQYMKAGETLGQTAFGQNLNVADTAAGQGLISALTNQSNKVLGQRMGDLQSQFAMSGQNLSGPLLQAQKQAVTESGQNLSDVLAQQLFGAYGQERALQQDALRGYAQFQETPANLAGQFMAPFSRGYQTAPPAAPMGRYLGK